MDLECRLPAYPAITPEASSGLGSSTDAAAPKPLSIEVAPFNRQELAQAIPVRAPQAGTNLVDLSCWYNAPLTVAWHSSGQPGNSLCELPQGLQHLAGVDFDVRGLIQVGSIGPNGHPYPRQVEEIALGRACRRLHFLHAAVWARPDGVQLGNYILHYVDGRDLELPLVIGRDIADWYVNNSAAPDCEVAWTGYNPHTRPTSQQLRLFKRTWDNPFPDIPIRSLDFISKGLRAAPFLVALTIEP